MKQALTAQDILAAAQGERESILTHRRTIHRDPEVGSPTPRTAAYIAGELKKLGLALLHTILSEGRCMHRLPQAAV